MTDGTADNAPPSYKSLNSVADIPTKDPREPDGDQSITHKIFYSFPDPDLPEQANLPDGSTTWLRTPPSLPTVSTISIAGVEGTPNELSPKGAYIGRSEEHTSELQSLLRITYAVFCFQKK